MVRIPYFADLEENEWTNAIRPDYLPYARGKPVEYRREKN
jgi:hypothetical protein